MAVALTGTPINNLTFLLITIPVTEVMFCADAFLMASIIVGKAIFLDKVNLRTINIAAYFF